MNIDNLFMAKVRKCDSTGCWLWHGSLDGGGYGKLCRGHNGKRLHYLAHRYSYEMHNGPITESLFVCHTCDIPSCVNPAHLFLGTHSDNMKDCAAKGRGRPPRGEKHGRAKLSDADAVDIRMFLTLGAKGRDIANAYGVSRQTVHKIKYGKLRRHQLSQTTTNL